jgi:pimeloyl-ACP methyl ester carboxylesterase
MNGSAIPDDGERRPSIESGMLDVVDASVCERSRVMNARNYEGVQPEGEPVWEEWVARDRLSEVRTPTLVVVGTEDVEDMVEIAHVLEREVAGARLVTIEGAAHHLHMEKPGEFNAAVLEFLAGCG